MISDDNNLIIRIDISENGVFNFFNCIIRF
jgi:hypothetical protein